MIKITKSEAIALRNEGLSKFVKKTYTKNPTYYCVEDSGAINRLTEIRNSLRSDYHS